jgi:hypothetical protein
MGFEAVRWLARYLALGAAIVLPIWLVVRGAGPKGAVSFAECHTGHGSRRHRCGVRADECVEARMPHGGVHRPAHS